MTAEESHREPVAWIVSRFPVVTETFILREMDELERRGVDIDLYTLVRDEPDILHASAVARLADMTAGSDPGLRKLIASQFRWMARRPGRLIKAWTRALVGNRRSLRFLARALVVVPVAAYFAERMQESGVKRVHAHWATHPALAAYVIHLLTDLPYSVTAHAHDIQVNSSMLAEKLGSADQVITVSEFNRRHLIDAVPELEDRCSVVRCGVPRASVAAVAPVIDHDDDSTIELSCIASLKPYKGHRHLLGACRRLVDRGHQVRCTIAGSGPELERLQQQVTTLELDEHVVFVGAIDGQAVSRLLDESDVFVLPSTIEPSGKMEGIPVALMEAMAAGTSVVASRLSGIPELVAHEVSGLLVEPGDEEALALAVERIVSNPERAAAMASAALGRIEAEFTVEHNATRLASLLGLSADACDGRITLDLNQGRAPTVDGSSPQLSRN